MVPKFIKRTIIKDSVRTWGEAGIVYKDTLNDRMIEICTKLQNYHPNRILTCPIQLLIKRQKVAEGEKRMRAKAQITWSVSSNARVSHILPPYLIFVSKKSHCFYLDNSSECRRLVKTTQIRGMRVLMAKDSNIF